MTGSPSRIRLADAWGYVIESVADRDLGEAGRAAMRGEPFLCPGAVDTLIRDHLARAREGGGGPGCRRTCSGSSVPRTVWN